MLVGVLRFSHLCRIVWAVPNGKKATEGRYIPAKEEEWEKQGERLLRVLLDATTMLPIGEDLVSLNP